jgi:hypothetical protein
MLKRLSRYINGLRYEIQDEISILFLKTVEDAYQAALKAEEKLARKQSQKNRGRILARGKGQSSGRGRFQTPKDEGGSSSSSHQEEENQEAEYFSQEAEVEEANKLDVTHVERHAICHGTVQKINQ